MNTEHKQNILIIDDHPLFRKGLMQLIQSAAEFNVAGEASGGNEGIALAHQLQPDMILLDLNMKDMTGIDVLKAIKQSDLDARIIMLTVSDSAEDLVAALRAGADGYLLKDMEPEDLLADIRSAALGKMTLSDKLTLMLSRALTDGNRPATPGEAGLTIQEERILELIATGKSNKLIANDLSITEGTVKVHVKHLLKKLNLKSRVEAAVWVIEQTNKNRQNS
jgi:two-component system, NarL family, nitrate/nitrite response regulator NarL